MADVLSERELIEMRLRWSSPDPCVLSPDVYEGLQLLDHIAALESDLASSEAENKELTQAANLLSLDLSEAEAARERAEEALEQLGNAINDYFLGKP